MLFRALTPLFPISAIMDFWLYIENGKFLDLTSNVILNQREIIFPTIYYMMYFGEIDFFCLPSSMGCLRGGVGGGGWGSLSENAQGSRSGTQLIFILNVLNEHI